MAKSTGNIARVGELLAAGVSPRALRLALISVHYRAALNHSDESLAAAAAALDRLDAAVAALDAYREDRARTIRRCPTPSTRRATRSEPRSTTTSTSRPALAVVFDLVRDLNRRIERRVALDGGRDGRSAALRDLDHVLAILPDVEAEARARRSRRCSRRERRRGPPATSPPPTGCATSWPRWASPSRTRATGSAGGGASRPVMADRPRPGGDEHSEPRTPGERRGPGGKSTGKPPGKPGREGRPVRGSRRQIGRQAAGRDRTAPRSGAVRPVDGRPPSRSAHPRWPDGDVTRATARDPREARGGRRDREIRLGASGGHRSPGAAVRPTDRRPPRSDRSTHPTAARSSGHRPHGPERAPRRGSRSFEPPAVEPPYRGGPPGRGGSPNGFGPPYRGGPPDRSGPPNRSGPPAAASGSSPAVRSTGPGRDAPSAGAPAVAASRVRPGSVATAG